MITATVRYQLPPHIDHASESGWAGREQ